MYATLTQYRVNPIFKEDFVASWHEIMDELKRVGKSHAGNLHRESRISYLSYILWYSRDTYDHIHSQEYQKVADDIKTLHSYCNDVKLLHRMEIIKQVTPSTS